MVCGVLAAMLLILEATRRTVGWVLPAICIGFVAYAYLGGLMPDWTGVAHKGYGLERSSGSRSWAWRASSASRSTSPRRTSCCSRSTARCSSTPAPRASSWSSRTPRSARSRTGPGRTTTMAGFLLGTVSGSGVATTVTLGSVTWPLLRKAGYPKDEGGGVLAAAGIGAILSPPTLGAAAFIIAEFLEESYLNVLVYATVPTLLYYLGVLLAIEADARRFEVTGLDLETAGFWRLLGTLRLPLPVAVRDRRRCSRSATRRSAPCSTRPCSRSCSRSCRRRDRMTPRKVWAALVDGARGVLPIAATTAAAGLIVAVVSLTGLGLKLASLIVDAAGGSLALTAVFSAIAVLILGLAVPVTASFIIAAVIIAPAFILLEVEDVRRLHVHLLLRGPERGEPADGAVGVRGGGDHRRRRLPHDDADVPLHGARVPGPVRVRADAEKGEGLLLQGGAGTIAVAVVGLGGGGLRAGGRARRLAARARARRRCGCCSPRVRCCCSTWRRSRSRSGWGWWPRRWCSS